MGKSGKLFKSLVAGVRVFKSPSKERPVKDDKEHAKRRSKDKCFGSLGKSASRNREVITAVATSPEAIEIKCVQVESEKLKDVLPVPVAESFAPELYGGNKAPAKSPDGVINCSGFVQLTPAGSKELSAFSDQQEWAASKIQAAFRCYLAQRAFRALRSLVRLQALARGRIVRRQASASLRCVNALIRIQALARGRRVRNSELGQLVQKHIQQTKQSKKKSPEGWVNSTATAQQLHVKAQVKHDAATKRQRALVYAYSEQLNRRAQKVSSSSGLEGQIDKSLWIWAWLERWTAATPKGGSAAIIPTRDGVSVTRNIEKGKSSSKGGKYSENPRKERRKWGEHAESISPLPQRDFISEECEEPNTVVEREDEIKASPESERPIGTPTASVQKLISQSPTPSPSPLSPLKEGNDLAARGISVQDLQPSATEMFGDMIQATSSNCSAEAKIAIQSISDTSSSTDNGTNNASEAEKTWQSDAFRTSSPLTTSQVSLSSSNVGTTNGHAVYVPTELSHMDSDSPSTESKENSLSASSFSPLEQEACTPSETVSAMDYSKEVSSLGFSVVALEPPIPESPHDAFLSGMHQPEEVIQATNRDASMCDPHEAAHSVNGDMEKHMNEETGYSIDGCVNEVSCEAGVVIEEVGLKNNDLNHVDALSETNGGCDASEVSVGGQSTEVSSNNPSGVCLRHEHTECTSPSLPSYMATTKSSKAKVRMLTSPKPKSDSPKQKLESPKPKSDSPKTKVDSPTQKPDSASKRRHSLSALDGGKVSPGTQKPAFHVRASSKGNFSSLKDLSTDNLSLANGDSRRHGK
ncbi:hypothetical protein GOP47_0013398 [Adiantum capillus-veneris]|uniref:DUF4005 domain-containing protein n=1 Tax=Adiantum capillus-veneris TaxID=13818 RepID=A0A9D4UNY8_ADICA|nr:hypothetical protein GOP47_0013398 [Adiantum capillus-veneris]